MGSFPHPEETAERENKTGKEEKPEEEKGNPKYHPTNSVL